MDLLVVLGPTASGKTSFAANMASKFNTEIISADSRQVYRNMNLGTGKDYSDYCVDGKQILYHLIDIVDAGYKYNVYEYQSDFLDVYNKLKQQKKIPVLCGGTGMYIEAITKGYKLINVPINETLRDKLSNKSLEELIQILLSYKKLHANTDTSERKRLIRAIEIEIYYSENKNIDKYFPKIKSLLFGIKFDRQSQRRRITERLKQRLDEGMVTEVEKLIESGVPAETLIFYGLEYKFLTKFVLGEIDFDTMFTKLNTAIHQFAKRQMTWYRRMERNGAKIYWLDGYMSIEEKIERAEKIIIAN